MHAATPAALLGLLLCGIQSTLASHDFVKRAPAAKAAAPTVTIASGKYVGSSINDVESFLGLPYAEPPVGDLRLRPTKPYNRRSTKTINATVPGNDCPSTSKTDPIPGGIAQAIGSNFDMLSHAFPQLAEGVMSEDCLFLNVQRPKGTTNKSKLPVMVWIYGGAFELGGISAYNGTGLIQQSVVQKQPIIYVAMNYRVSAWGFLPGAEAAKAGATNLGLLDQREALRWVQKNIGAFGGDPSRVTLFGESAGAISIGYQALLNDGDNEGLWHAAIAQSGSADPAGPTSFRQDVFDKIVQEAGCASKADKIDCLRKLEPYVFQNAVAQIPGLLNRPDGKSLALSFRPRVDGKVIKELAPNLLKKGKFTRVPLITGDCADEGTLFAIRSMFAVFTEDMLYNYYYPVIIPKLSRALFSKILAGYPQDPAAGSPFGTGSNYSFTPQWKRLAAINGDAAFHGPRRLTQQYYLKYKVPVWTYAWNKLSTSNTSYLGTSHASDIAYTLPTKEPQLSDFSSKQMRALWISFAVTLDPNNHNQPNLQIPKWPQFTSAKKAQLNFNATKTILGQDNFREEGISVFVDNSVTFVN